MNRIAKFAKFGSPLLLATSLLAMPALAVELGGGIAGGSCGAASDLVRTGASAGFSPVLTMVNGTPARLEGTERRGTPDAVAQEAQWIRRADLPIAEPGLWVLLTAGVLGMWAVARRRIHSS